MNPRTEGSPASAEGAAPNEPIELLDRVLMSDDPEQQLEQLMTAGILSASFPEVAAMVGFGGDGQGHKDLWGHTKKVVAQTVSERAVRWAALFHDVGKVPTFSRDTGKVTFHGHEVVSARMFDKAARRTEMEREFRKRVRFLVRHLGHVEAYSVDWTDSAVRRLHRDMGEHFAELVKLARADITTKHADKRRRHRERMDELVERARVIAEADSKLPLLPKGLGTEIIRELGLAPGPRVGEIMAELEQAVERGDVPPRAEPNVYVEYLKNRKIATD